MEERGGDRSDVTHDLVGGGRREVGGGGGGTGPMEDAGPLSLSCRAPAAFRLQRLATCSEKSASVFVGLCFQRSSQGVEEQKR